MTPTFIGGENKLVSVVGVNPPADIASGRIAEVRSRSMSCNCMTRTSQQECRGILELVNLSMNDNTIILIVHGLRKFEKSRYERSVLDTAKPRGCVPGGASCAVIVI